MPKKLAFIMDAPEFIHPEKDSSLVLIEEAKRRKYKIDIYQQKDLVLRENKVFFNDISAADYEYIFMRKDPPVDLEYIYSTMILELAEKEGVKVINSPKSLRDFNEKLFISLFPEIIPPTLTTYDPKLLKDFLKTYKDIILKPLNGMGGKSIFRVTEKDFNINVIIEMVTNNGSNRAMAQVYLPEVTQGDKRIILFHGKPIPYAISRFAKPGETRANLAAGGSYQKAEITARDKVICDQVGPVLKANGILFAGLDIIGGYLTEINITSPTCLREIDKLFGVNTAEFLFEGL